MRDGVLNTALCLLVLAGLSGLVWLAIGQPLQDWRATQLTNRSAAIAETQRLHRSIAMLRSERAQYDGGDQLDILWQAEQAGTATALIQAEVSQMALEQGVSLRSISPLRQRDLALGNAIGVRVELEAPLDQLANFLRAVEYNSPALLVERATLRRLNKPNTQIVQPLIFAQIDLSAPVLLTAEARP